MSNRLDSGLKYIKTLGKQPDLDDCFADEIVPINLIFCPYPAYGRPVRSDHVMDLTDGKPFDIAKTRIMLSLRNDGRYACVDGNHTAERMRKEGYSHVRARVYIDRSLEEEAQLFSAFDSQRRISPIQHFLTDIAGKDETSLRVQRIVHDHGMDVAAGKKEGVISAVGVLLWIHNTHGANLLADTLGLIRSAFGLERVALKAEAIKGISRFWRRYSSVVDRDRLVRLMSDTGARRLLLNAAQHHATHASDTLDVAYGKQLQELYDRGLREKNKLPEWKSRAYSDATLNAMPERGRRAAEIRIAKGEDLSATSKKAVETRRARGEDLSATSKKAAETRRARGEDISATNRRGAAKRKAAKRKAVILIRGGK